MARTPADAGSPRRPGGDERGVAFPLSEGRRSTSAAGKTVFAAAARAADPALADAIEAEPAWRKRYLGHVRRLLEAGLDRAATPVASARAGLDAVHGRFELVTDDGAAPTGRALAETSAAPLATATVEGRGDVDVDVAVPYRGEVLRGDALHRQLDRWVADGIIEPSLAEAVRAVMANPDWLDLSDQRVVALGAGAELGPLAALCRWGAHVLPVDVPDAGVWARILQAVRAGRGRASVPLRTPTDTDDDSSIAAAAGADLTRDLPSIAAWLTAFDGPLTLTNHAYADGAAHTRVAVAADALQAHLVGTGHVTATAFLATPTDVFAAPEDAVADSRRRFARPGRLGGPLAAAARTVSGGRLYAPNYPDTVTTAEGVRFGVADTLLPQQGPNYVLAKRIQRWRGLVAAADGLRVSANVCPPTRTRSVMTNRLLSTAYEGAGPFGVEIFDSPTSAALMAALLVHDLRNPKAAGAPGHTPAHPEQLFADAAAHAGLWRIAYAPRSVLPFALLLGALPRRRRSELAP